MHHTKTIFLAVLFLLVGANTTISAQTILTTAIPSSTSTKTIYHFPPPMDDPGFPFKTVTIDENTPEWAKLLYEVRPNIVKISALYDEWRRTHSTVKNGHTRNYRKLAGYLYYHHYVDENGFMAIPSEETIQLEAQQILKDRATAKRRQNESAARSDNNTTWNLLGPTFMKDTKGELNNTQINIYSITQSLSNTDILYAVSEAGGTVFKTTNNGDTWFSVSDDLITNMGSRNIEVAPSDPDVVYLCTRHDILKTTVGGNVWNSVYNGVNSNNLTLLIHPTNPDTVFAGGSRGLLKSVNGGQSWTTFLPFRTVYDLRYQPGSTKNIYALVNNPTSKQTEFYKSTDGGETWTIRNNGWPNEPSNANIGGQMTTSDGHDHIIYAFVGASWTNANNKTNIKIVKSSDYGESWVTKVDYDNSYDSDRGVQSINKGQGFYDWDIEMSDVDSNIIACGTQGSWVTYVGFDSLVFNDGLQKAWSGHADVQEILFNGDEIWAVNDGGITKYENDSLKNFEVKCTGVNAISYWGFDLGWNKDVSAATHYHNGTSFMHENYEDKVGVTLGGAEPHFPLVAQPNGEKVLSKGYGSVNGYHIPDVQNGTFSRFNYNMTPNVHNYSGNNAGTHVLANQTHFLGTENFLVKSEDFGVTWDTLYEFPASTEKVWDIEITRANPDALFVSTIKSNDGNLYRSLDGGQSFTEVSLPSFWGTSPTVINVSVSNEDANVFYVMGDRYGIKIAKTLDGGATWIDMNTTTLDAYDGHKIMQVDGTDGGVYLLATRGVFYRNNTLPDWVLLSEGLPANTTFQYIRPFYRDKELRIATARGVYEAELYDTPQLSNTLLQPTVGKTKTDCARDTFYFDDFSVVEHAGATWSWNFPGAAYVSATNVRNPKVVFGQAGEFDVTISITKNGQTYTKTVEKMVTVGNACSQIDGFAGKALKLNRSTKDRAVTESFDVTTNTFTFSAWIKPTATLEGFAGIFSNGRWCAHCNDQTLGLVMNYWGDRLYYRWPGSTSIWYGASNLYPKLDEWQYVAFVMSPNKVTLYLNEQKWESNISHDPATLTQLYLGFGHYSHYFDGFIEEATFWNKSLTEQEIRELMHLTKDPTNDPDLLAYYQFNEKEGVIFDKAGVNAAILENNASRVVSSAPVGKGFGRQQAETNGNVDFGNAGFTANFTNQSGIVVVASKIETTPYNTNGLLTGDVPLGEEYWAVHRYGAGDFAATLTFQTNENLTATDQNQPNQFALYKRGNRSDEDWEFVGTATSVTASTNKIMFTDEVAEWSQYLIAKAGQAIMRAKSPLVLKNTVVGSTSAESSYTFSAADLTANVQITAPAGFEISLSSGTGFSAALTLNPTNGQIAATPIFVRFSPTESKEYKADIQHTSTGTPNLAVEVSSTGFVLDRFPGTAMRLDGSNDYVHINNADLTLGNQMTIEFWADYDGSIGTNTSVLEAVDKDNNRVLNLHFPWSNNRIYFDGGNVGSSYDRIDKIFSSNEIQGWNHWAFVKDAAAGTMKIYRNGELWHQGTGKTKPFPTIEQIYLGRRQGGNYWNGKLDELRIWNIAKTQQAIREELHLTAKGDETGLVTYFQFNESAGNVQDYIGNLRGILHNGANNVTATEPVGGGFSNTQTETNGSITFNTTDFTANFSSQNGAEIVASKLELAPNDDNGIGANEVAADNQYWVVNRYGTGNFSANVSFTLTEDVTVAEQSSPNTLKLYGRNQTSDGNWTLVAHATSVNAATNQVTFNGVTTFEQYLITRNPFPKISISSTHLKFGDLDVGSSSELSYEVSGTDLSSNLVITPPAGFAVSQTSGSGFVTAPNTLSIAPSSGTIASTTIYVQFAPNSTDYQAGDIVNSTNGALAKSVRVDGTGVQPEIEIRKEDKILANNASLDFGTLRIGETHTIILTVRNKGVGNLNLSGSPKIAVVGANVADFTINETATATNIITDNTTTFEITFNPTSAGAKNANISIVNNDADENPTILNLTGTGQALPEITVGALTNFTETQLVGTSSVVKSYTVSGTNLLGGITVTSTPSFELSLNNTGGFSNQPIRLTANNETVATTTIYVRFTPASVAAYEGTILHTATEAVTKTINIQGNSSKAAETVPGMALDFDGVNDYVQIDATDVSLSTAFTVEFWANQEGGTGDRNAPFYAIGANNSRVINIHLPWAGSIYFDAGDNGDYDRINKGASAADFDGWHHWAFVKDATAGTMKIYRDGIIWHEGTGKTKTIGAFDRIFLGRNEGNGYYDGQLEEVRLWNTARTQTQIRENIHLTQLTTDPNLLVYQQFNETNYNTIFNVKGSAHGSLINGVKRIASTRPVGGGFSDTKTENSSTISFSDTDVEVNFVNQSGAEVVVSKINLAPNALPAGVSTAFDKQYWAVHRYGTGNFTGNVTFKVAEDLTTFHQNNPSQILLYGRAANSDAAWQLVKSATNVNAANDKATFNNITAFDQYLIASLKTDFTVDRTGVCLNSSVQFTDDSEGTPSTWKWTFEGGTPATSNAQNPSITYNSSGSFDATLVIDEGLSSERRVTKTDLITVANQLVPTITPTKTTICLGESVNLTASGGTTYTWNSHATLNTTSGATVTATPTSTITYTVMAADAAGCTGSNTIQIIVNPLPTATISGTTTICQNATNPSVTFTGTNGTAPYTFTYKMNGGANQTITTTSGNAVAINQNTNTSGVFAYTLVSVVDANGCTRNQSGTATITINALPTATISNNITVCKNATPPTVTFTGGNGQAPYTFTYKINNGSNQTRTTTNGNSVSVTRGTNTVGSFTYTLVSVIDGNGCSQNQSGSAVITVNELPTATISGTTDVYQNGANPDLTFIAANGTAPYTFTYIINNGTNQIATTTSGNTIKIPHSTANLGTFTYTLISVIDANSCSQNQSGTATVKVNPLPTAGISGTATVCQGGAAPEILFTSDHRTAPYTFTYKINGGANQTITTTSGSSVTLAQSTASAGTFVYTLISIKDANNATQNQTGTATITINPRPTATISGNANVCKNAATPSVTFTGANGTAPYTFTYTINGSSPQNITTTSGNSISLTQATGSAGTFIYTLVSVQDAKSCSRNQSGTATITVNELPTASISGTTTVYNNDANPSITFTGTNGTAPYTFTYNINNGANRTATTTSGNSVSIPQSTSTVGDFVYKLVSVQDSKSCAQTQTGTATITVKALPTAGISGTTTVCQNSTPPNILFTSSEGTAPYTFTYKINNGANRTVTTSSGNSVNVSQPTGTAGTFTYTLVSIKDANNATQAQSGSVTITVGALATATVTGSTEVCLNETAPAITFTGNGGTSPYTFSFKINNGATKTITTTVGNFIAINQVTDVAGTFTYTLLRVEDASGCGQNQSGTATVKVNPPPTASIGGTISVTKNDPTPQISFTGANGKAPYTFTYKINDGANKTVTTTSGNSTTVAQPTTNEGTFTYQLISVQDANNCAQIQNGTATVTVDPYPLPNATISGTNTICQNGNNLNITFTGANGTAPYTFTYKINNGANRTVTTNSSNSTTVTQSTATAGNFVYTLVSVKDNNNVSQTQSGTATITVRNLPTATISGITEVCQNNATPTITFTGNGGTAPYTFTYKINDGATKTVTTTSGTAVTVNQATATVGTFTYILLRVTDANGCTQNQSGTASIKVNQLPAATISGTTTVTKNDPAPQVTFTGSIGKAPYTFTYKINNGANKTITTTSGNSVKVAQSTASDGGFTYQLVSVADANGCTKNQTGMAVITVGDFPVPVATISGTTEICENSSSPSITFTGANGTAPYTFTYQINNGTNRTVTTTSGNSITVTQSTAQAGTFVYKLVNVQDANTATQNQSGTATITVKAAPTIVVFPGDATLCAGQTVLQMAEGAATYTWSPNVGISATSGDKITVQPTKTQNYTVTGTAANGCTDTYDFTATVGTDCCTGGNAVEYENTNNLPDYTHASDYIKAGNINGQGNVNVMNGQSVEFKSNKFVLLTAGFAVQPGANFKAEVDDCGAGIVEETPTNEMAKARNIATTNKSKITTDLAFKIYPNPFENQFFVDYQIDKPSQVTIQLFDILGKKVSDILVEEQQPKGIYQAAFNNQYLSEGTYILVIRVNERMYQRKVVMGRH